MSFIDYFSDLMQETITIERLTNVSDAMGGQTATASTVTTFSGGIWQNTEIETIREGRRTEVSTHTIAAPPTTGVLSILPSDIAVIGSDRYTINRVNDIIQQGEAVTIEAQLIE